MCSDWIGFLDVRCLCDKTGNGNTLYNLQCVKQSVNEKLTLNKYMRTHTKNDNEYDENKNLLDRQSLETIMENIYDSLNGFYAELKATVYFWLSFDWLSGVDIFTEYHSSDDMNGIKERSVDFNNEDIPTLAMYDQLLPLNLNLEILVDFKALTETFTLHYALRFIWHHAKIISVYFKRSEEANIDELVFKNLKSSSTWYRTATTILFGTVYLNDLDDYVAPSEIEYFVTSFI